MKSTSMIIMMIGTLFFWGYVAYIILQWRKMKYKSNLQQKLIDKFNTVPELNEFLQSKGGNKFLNFLAVENLGPKEKLLSSIYKGIILVLVGIAFAAINGLMSDVVESTRIFVALGIFIFILGGGFIISAFISYKISKKWGIIDTENEVKNKEPNG